MDTRVGEVRNIFSILTSNFIPILRKSYQESKIPDFTSQLFLETYTEYRLPILPYKIINEGYRFVINY